MTSENGQARASSAPPVHAEASPSAPTVPENPVAGRKNNVPAIAPWRRRLRSGFLTFHRITGFFLVVFLVVAGLTGSILVFNHDLDAALNPALFLPQPPTPGAPLLDPFELRERVSAQSKSGPMQSVIFDAKPGHAVVTELGERQIFINPYDGRILGSRTWGAISEGVPLNLMPFVLRLHYSLALGEVGVWLFGIAALLWTIDCFVGAYLTFPPAQKRRDGQAGKSWMRRWLPSWLMKTSQLFSTIFTFHRAAGLWLWAMLLVFAWTSVGFNLNSVYKPVMGAFGYRDDHVEAPPLAHPLTTPALDWRAAHARGKELMRAEVERRGITVHAEGSLSYDADRGRYDYSAHTSRDLSPEWAATSVSFDGNTGDSVAFHATTGEVAANTVSNWLFALHMAEVGGLPYRIFVAVLGLVIPALAISGIWIWWRKRQGRAGQVAGT